METTGTSGFGHPVLAGVDGSANSPTVVRYAVAEAGRRGVGLLLVHVRPDFLALSPMLPLSPAALDATGQDILRTAGAQATAALGVGRVRTVLDVGARVTRLVRAAERAAVVVLGRDPGSRRHRLTTGATTVGVATRAGCPVMTVPGAWDPPAGPTGPVVAALRTTEHARTLLEHGFRAASERHTRLLVVHAWELPSGYDHLLAGRAEAQWADRLRRQVEGPVAHWASVFPEVEVDVRIVRGQPAEVLLDASREADLEVLVRRSHGGAAPHLGGTARWLLRASTCPVEVVPLGAGTGFGADLVLERDGDLVR